MLSEKNPKLSVSDNSNTHVQDLMQPILHLVVTFRHQCHGREVFLLE